MLFFRGLLGIRTLPFGQFPPPKYPLFAVAVICPLISLEGSGICPPLPVFKLLKYFIVELFATKIHCVKAARLQMSQNISRKSILRIM
jgi:hypothetical protein